ncbi:class II aldolase/adducin family protein [Peribacillus frigoritolerans]|uniref:class II aldolase/adducin family protein n=1 Tax=Peribacillus frigoritolerans TaxID=450367 RepID=UPI0023D987FE|nr:class II aldolase/adducin family protein [Peribacillus frigoritolerans]MDF2000899.1 class II aldolase/adducin family protein [Peribacillus frigoritolerans]
MFQQKNGKRFEEERNMTKTISLQPATFNTMEEERNHRKERLAASFRLFSKFGFDEGIAGHITVRDPKYTDHFWVNPFGMHFSQISVSDLILVNHKGDIVEGEHSVNGAAFAIHSEIHKARPDAIAAAHAHSVYGKTWSSLGRLLDPITQDACQFYNDHALFDDFTGVVYASEEGRRIAKALGQYKAVILRNHGLLTVGQSVDSAAWWFITMERSCQAQIMAESVGKSIFIEEEYAKLTAEQTGTEYEGWLSFQPLWERIRKEQPDFLK